MNETAKPTYFESILPYVCYALIFLNFFASILNCFVIFTASNLYKSTSDAVHLFIGSMTVADLLITAVSSPLNCLQTLGLYHSSFTCYIHQVTAWLGLSASGLSLSLLNVEKLIYFQWPLTYDNILTNGCRKLSVLFVWLTSGCFVASVWANPAAKIINSTICFVETVFAPWYELNAIAFCVLPILSSTFLSIYLWQLIRRKQHSMPTNNDDNQRRKMRAFVFIFATTMWTSFSLLPSRMFNLARKYNAFNINSVIIPKSKFFTLIQWSAWIFYYSVLLNPVVNPVITVTIYAPYRQALLKKLSNLGTLCHKNEYIPADTYVTTSHHGPSVENEQQVVLNINQASTLRENTEEMILDADSVIHSRQSMNDYDENMILYIDDDQV